MKLSLFFATNRKHNGARWQPKSYGKSFSNDGRENLRFGRLTVEADDKKIKKYLKEKKGNGEELGGYLAKKVKKANITAYEEKIDPGLAEAHQEGAVFGSLKMFADLKANMTKNKDILVYIHGFNVSWEAAVGAALSLQIMMNEFNKENHGKKEVMVVLFTWPSDGLALPLVSYKSDRSDAEGSGYAIGRGFLKLRDFLKSLTKDELCGQKMHLLSHSMGNYVLQNAVRRMLEFNSGHVLPRLFEHIFLCSPDVNDNVLEPNKSLGQLHEMCKHVTIYHNRDDVAMRISDITKGNPDRLGTAGAARPHLLHNKIHQIDCSEEVKGFLEHSYYLWGPINNDIRMSIDDVPFEDPKRTREKSNAHENLWTFVAPPE